jgi:hypothetical protein
MRSLLVLLAIAIGVGATACGDSGSPPTSSSSSNTVKPAAAQSPPTPSISPYPPPPKRPGVNDTYDGEDGNPGPETDRQENNDDAEVERFGRAATQEESQSATAFAHEYYAAAAIGDGATACSLMVPSLAVATGGRYEKPGDPKYLAGKTCFEVMTKLFRHEHKLAVKKAAGLHVTGVRVSETTGRILVAFTGIRDRRYLGVQRSTSGWRLEALTDSAYP